MEEKRLGKIDYAEFGLYPDRPFLIGLQLGFYMQGSCVKDGGRYTVNISPECKWDSLEEKDIALYTMIGHINAILKKAKVNYVSELVGIPVEVTLENYKFKSFRILEEVLQEQKYYKVRDNYDKELLPKPTTLKEEWISVLKRTWLIIYNKTFGKLALYFSKLNRTLT